ncbi:MAG: NAD(P)H-dependent oxidoreductase [Alphaproteobacteria bacterium]|nr:NAD(P)H-dependent oxidoreductase [Alphaproteobacteria bacterium]MBU1516084.1 NAD(P)H-dependent oxidoreductase [Alphaproteobacteria bacterium]MBU2092701.1 NAD(P)H-dependent oxidoreductase [Alphaproteobacteria bacterium]MBU2153774.1 NAD(P)H-dependent oxidoreductase [Alphaproteobacteria bacterium]MBU2308402.1 NAD(P)H-dependent oxidoreductase [Alphaproteobacteria bacterium]
MTVKLLAFAGSTRNGSLNQALLELAVAEARAKGAEVTTIKLKDFALPLYDGDLERDAFPQAARDLKALFVAHHGFLIASPEYNGSVTSVLKNAIDWASRPTDGESLVALSAFRGKVAGLMAASISPFGGLRGVTHLRQILGTIQTIVATEQVLVPAAHGAFDENWALKEALPAQLLGGLAARVIDLATRLEPPVG